ncbi:GGDEF domain-containing protein [Klenkia sp. LSe6-5]|uniref:GGDEF domain-containing protein n=1 Tax=Klenkia sesuvii TaxID=3103137 RepID=A0ABU8DNZ7_9ACTN
MRGQVRRHVYLAIAALGLAGCAWQIWRGRTPDVERVFTFPLLAAFLLGAVVVLVWAPARIRWVEVGGFAVLGTVWMTTAAVQLAGTADAAEAWLSLFPGPFANLCLMVVLAHLWFDGRWALVASLLAPTLALTIGLARFLPDDVGYALDLVGAIGYVLVLAMLAYLMARSKEALARSRAEASRLRELAHTDVLTGLPNRRRLMDALHAAVQDRRADGRTAVVLFDLDHFKGVNDRYGHDIGDLVLQEVTDVVLATLRPDAVFGRWGGEEFLVVVPQAGVDEGAAVAERLRQAISDHPFSGGLSMTASFGVSVVSDADSVDAVLLRADRLLYVAKDSGRDLVVTRLPRP